MVVPDSVSPDRLRLAGLRFAITGTVATITLARPERRNPQTPRMWSALTDLAAALPDEVRVVVVRGAGASFSAGLDVAMFGDGPADGGPRLSELADMPTGEALKCLATYQAAFTWPRRPNLVTIAAVQGHAVGAGFQLALACDLRVLAEDAQFTMAETGLGLVPDLGGTRRLVELVGYPRALEICGSGRRVGAGEALALGLAELVVPLADLDATLADLTAALLAPPRAALAETKALLQEALHRSPEEQLAAERAAQLRRLRDLAAARA